MTTRVVNLRQWRKDRARDEKRRAADGNAAKHGRTKAERAAEDEARVRAARHLDEHKREE